MELDLGGIEKIAAPSAEDLKHYLRYMPVESPWIVLADSDESFIQAIYDHGSDRYRVEYKRSGKQFFVLEEYEKAVLLFTCFLEDECQVEHQAEWKKLTVFNAPSHPIAVGLACILLISFIVLAILNELGLL